MSHKKRRFEPSSEPANQAVVERAADGDTDREAVAVGTQPPEPSRRAKILLILASLLLAGWIGFLIILAILAAHPKV